MNWFIKISSSAIPVEYVYDVFAISFINHPLEQDEKQIIEFHLEQIRDYISKVFLELMRKQIVKYVQRERIDNNKLEFLNKQNASAKELATMFNQYTFRSDMQRNNVNWGNIALAVDKLQSCNNINCIVSALGGVGGLFNLVHNTGTPVLDKLTNGYALLDAFEKCHLSKNPKEIISKASKDIRKIILRSTTYR